METETIDRLFLELSQVTKAKTKVELDLLAIATELTVLILRNAPEAYVAACGKWTSRGIAPPATEGAEG